MVPTLGEALESTVSRLGTITDSPRAEAEELLSRLLGLSRSRLYLERARPLEADDVATLERWLSRRVAGEPIQYVTGRAAFRDLDLGVSPAVLIPRPETELLIEAVLETLAEERDRWTVPRILDLGTGSGAIALAIAHEWPPARVIATDLSEAALDVARANATRTGLEPRVQFRRGDWFEAVAAEEHFEVIVANPPYIAPHEVGALPADVREHEPALALYSGDDGLEALREIVEGAPRSLVTGGLLAVELAEARAHDVVAWFEGARDWERATLRDDLAGRPRLLLARRQRGPAIAPAQWGEDPDSI
jgi:release factor glutamine methyltransferase